MLNSLCLTKRSSTTWQKIKNHIHQNLSSNLYNMPVTMPDEISIRRFEDNAVLLEHQIYNNKREIRTLSLLRNWLLPMLMNGQATISD